MLFKIFTNSKALYGNKKVDKASMLDEAIEYLKSLQLQVQVTLATLKLIK